MAEIYHQVVKDRRIAVRAVPVQQQVEDLDCGVHSIDAAYNDAMGRNMGAVTYDADKMRAHLEQCFEKEELTPFPPPSTPVQRCSLKHLFI